MAKKKGAKGGRFVTLRSGQVIFIPKGKKSKWADVKDKIGAKAKAEVGRTAAWEEAGLKPGDFGVKNWADIDPEVVEDVMEKRDVPKGAKALGAKEFSSMASRIGQVGDILDEAGVDTESNTMRALTSSLEGVRYKGGEGGDPAEAKGGLDRAVKLMEEVARDLEEGGEPSDSNLWRDTIETLEGVRAMQRGEL